jgi:hypothetical protein
VQEHPGLEHVDRQLGDDRKGFADNSLQEQDSQEIIGASLWDATVSLLAL